MHKTGRDAAISAVDPAEACRAALDAGLTVVTGDPLNCETPVPAPSSGLLTPAGRFYLRNHFPIPVLTTPRGGFASAGWYASRWN